MLVLSYGVLCADSWPRLTRSNVQDSSSFIAVTTTPDTATELVNKSPLERTVYTQDSAAATTFSTTSWGSAVRTTITDPVIVKTRAQVDEEVAKMDETARTEEIGLKTRSFTISVFPANAAFSHKRIIQLNPLHGPWPPGDSGDSYISAALRKSIPAGAMQPGLRDWETGRQLSAEFVGPEDEVATTLLGLSKHGKAFVKERLWKKQRNVPDVMKSLGSVADAPQPPPAPDVAKEFDAAKEFEDWKNQAR